MSKGNITIGAECNLKINDAVAEMTTRIDDKICDTWKIKREDIIKSLKAQQRIDKATEIAYQYAQIDGAHHKMWTIDQMLRELLGDGYDKFVKEYEEDGEYKWDIGIAP